MAQPKKPTGPKPVDALRHQDKHANIPTNELRGFVEGDESAPAAMLYPRDTSLDPQLVWKGKDEQDRQPLEVPVVPIYIQEKILPQVIIENLRDTARKGEPEPEMTLFNDYDGIEFQELVEFYRHEQNWANRMILGDSLLVMTSLAEKEGLKGKVPHMISQLKARGILTEEGSVRQLVVDNPVILTASLEPGRHLEFTGDDITVETLQSRCR